MSSTIAVRQLARRGAAAVAGSSSSLRMRPATVSRCLQTRFSSTMHDNNPDTLTSEKERNRLGKQHHSSTTHDKHAPGWNEYLASESEAVIKANQSDPNIDPKTLVEETVQRVKKRHHGDSVTDVAAEVVEKGKETVAHIKAETEQLLTSDNGERAEAKYEKDEVVGPLKEAVSKVADALTRTGNGDKRKKN